MAIGDVKTEPNFTISRCSGSLIKFSASILSAISAPKPIFFLKVLSYVAFERWKAYNAIFAFKAYCIVTTNRQAILNRPIAKEAFVFNLLNELWENSKDDTV